MLMISHNITLPWQGFQAIFSGIGLVFRDILTLQLFHFPLLLIDLISILLFILKFKGYGLPVAIVCYWQFLFLLHLCLYRYDPIFGISHYWL